MSSEKIHGFLSNTKIMSPVGFVWGLAEGVAFFIVPDVAISFAAFFSIRAGLLTWLFSIFGSLVSVGIVYELTHLTSYLSFLTSIPGISPALLSHVAASLQSGGLPYTSLLIFGGVPLKVYTASAFSLGFSFWSVLMWAVFARVIRIAPVFLIVIFARGFFQKVIDANPLRFCILLGMFWVVFYIYYFNAMTV